MKKLKNHRRVFQNHSNHENLELHARITMKIKKNPNDNYENHKNHRIQHENNEDHAKITELPWRITKIMKTF